MDDVFTICDQLKAARMKFNRAISQVDQLEDKMNEIKKGEGGVNGLFARHTDLCMLSCLREARERIYLEACTFGEEANSLQERISELTEGDNELYQFLIDSVSVDIVA